VTFKVIKTSVVPQVTIVRLYDHVFDHVKEHHGNDLARSRSFPLPCIAQAVGTAIADPSRVEQHMRDGSYIFVDEKSTNASGDPLKVAVKVIEGTSGRVRTFFLASSNANPNIIWRRT
jgi:hypothetical protein